MNQQFMAPIASKSRMHATLGEVTYIAEFQNTSAIHAGEFNRELR